MPTIQHVCDYLEQQMPTGLAENWDNVGLLLGDRGASVSRVMTCLTLTPDSVAEAVGRGAGMVVTHHPLPFRPLNSITTDSVPGKMIWQLAGSGIAVYSPHTAFDSAAAGINQRLARRLNLDEIHPLVASQVAGHPGSGRMGRLSPAIPAESVAALLKQQLGCPRVQYAGPAGHRAQTVGIACGSGGSFLDAAIRAGCDTFVTGEANFHACLEAHASKIGLFLVGHYFSERFAVEELAIELAEKFPDCEIWASRVENNPLLVF